MTGDTGTRWLVLLYQFPQGPGSRRVKVWRRLQSLGAVAVKNSVYVLPLTDQSREDFEWLLAELINDGAEGAILESQFVDGMSDRHIRELFTTARQADYQALVKDVEVALAKLPSGPGSQGDTQPVPRRVLLRARKRLTEIASIDFFDAQGRDRAAGAIQELEDRISGRTGPEDTKEDTMASTDLKQLTNRVWVTRTGVYVDRIASAWLIRRWIDPDAEFKFVSSKGYPAGRREVRFDMFEAEFTHQGDRCTFEVLAASFRPGDKALRSLGEIVHDIDLKDAKFGRPETIGIANLLAGLTAGTEDDLERIERGASMFEDLYGYFRGLQA